MNCLHVQFLTLRLLSFQWQDLSKDITLTEDYFQANTVKPSSKILSLRLDFIRNRKALFWPIESTQLNHSTEITDWSKFLAGICCCDTIRGASDFSWKSEWGWTILFLVQYCFCQRACCAVTVQNQKQCWETGRRPYLPPEDWRLFSHKPSMFPTACSVTLFNQNMHILHWYLVLHTLAWGCHKHAVKASWVIGILK